MPRSQRSSAYTAANRRLRRAGAGDPPIIQSVSPTRISDDVSDQIKQLIVSENLDEGARLPSERDLAERFGASRPTVSQALRRLSLLGMVDIRRGSGAYVLRKPQNMMTESVNLMLDLDQRSIGDLMQLRLWLETVGVTQAASRRHPMSRSDVNALTEALTRLVDASTDAARWIAADTVFHAAIVGLADNSYLTAFYESVHTAILTWEYDGWLRHDTEPEWIGATDPAAHRLLHEPIMRAVIDGEPDKASEAVLAHHKVMSEHLEAVGAALTRPD